VSLLKSTHCKLKIKIKITDPQQVNKYLANWAPTKV